MSRSFYWGANLPDTVARIEPGPHDPETSTNPLCHGAEHTDNSNKFTHSYINITKNT